ncbi:peptidase M76, partial [Globomyces pollinis-pini]
VECHDGIAAGYNPKDNSISICKNQPLTNTQITQTIIHELIHAYDHCTLKFDSDDCRQIACSEVRAAALSGDCDLTQELLRGHFAWFDTFKNCVERRAFLSTQMHPHCQSNAKDTVRSAMETSFLDRSPFEP